MQRNIPHFLSSHQRPDLDSRYGPKGILIVGAPRETLLGKCDKGEKGCRGRRSPCIPVRLTRRPTLWLQYCSVPITGTCLARVTLTHRGGSQGQLGLTASLPKGPVREGGALSHRSIQRALTAISSEKIVSY